LTGRDRRLRRRLRLSATAKIPQCQSDSYDQQSHGELAPWNSGRLIGRFAGASGGIFLGEPLARLRCSDGTGKFFVPDLSAAILLPTFLFALVLFARLVYTRLVGIKVGVVVIVSANVIGAEVLSGGSTLA
jgi:hypothetical protein